MRTIVLIASCLVITAALLSAGLFLAFGAPPDSAMDDYFISNGQEQTGGNNIVTDVVFDFRGFDTLGEATVLFTAVTGVALVLRRRQKSPDEEEEEEYEYE
jgi:multisubunit Na+/H+ antiporter MnhB subunit